MADSGHTLRGIDYKHTFAFTHLFKGFRLAIDPSKLGLALALLLFLYCGGRLMDAIWPAKHSAVPGEVRLYEASSSRFAIERDTTLAEMHLGLTNEMKLVGKAGERPSGRAVIHEYELRRETAVKAARDGYDALPKEAHTPAAAEQRDDRIRGAYAVYGRNVARVKAFETNGPFITLLEYEIDQVDQIASAVIGLRLIGPGSVLEGLSHLAITGPTWAIRFHPLYFVLFFAFFLLLWSIFGGAIARVAAVQVARDEKISVRQALRFSTGKVLSFIFAPLIPIIIVLALGVLLGVAALPMGIPYVGGIWSVVVGALFFLALLAGLVMALTTIGLIGGGHLMYPTIAVEGSDSFDAVSRSFSYLYARPWQLIFYSLVALAYGAVTYLFVRFFLYVLLWVTHVGIGMFLGWAHAADGSMLVNSLWSQPHDLMKLAYTPNYPALGTMHDIGGTLMSFWIYMTISLLGAYVISLYFSSSTIIYYLMRREVDATGLDDVYIEPSDDEFADPVPDVIPPEGAPVATDAMLDTNAPPANDPPPGAPAVPPTDTNEPNASGQPVDLPAPPAEENRDQT